MSLKFTPTDKNISFDDYNAFILIMEIEGQFQPMLLSMEDFASMAMDLGVSYQSESHTIMVPQYMLKYMEIAGQMKPTGITGALAKVNIQSQTFENFLDTTCNYYTVSGGLPGQYVFDAEGTHEVEIELTNNSPTDMLFATSCVSNIISMKNIKSIDSHTFTSCPYLEEIVIPNDVTEIHCMALSNTPITEFTIPNSVTRIGEYTFRECANLASVTIPESVTKIGDGAFYDCESLTSITIPNSVTSIGVHAFSECSSLTSITIPNGLTEIGYGTFYNCESLASITIPDSVTSIGDSAFYGCKNLTSVDLGNGVTTIGKYAFDNCKSLTEVTIPDSVTLIGNYVFQSCSLLASVYCKATTPPTSSDSVIFNGNAEGRKIYVPMASVDAYKSAAGWSNHANDIEGYNF
jgi:hypothetical protein